MSDPMEVWQLCQHGEVHEHGYDFDSVCPGGKRIVLELRYLPDGRYFYKTPTEGKAKQSVAIPSQGKIPAETVTIEVSDDE